MAVKHVSRNDYAWILRNLLLGCMHVAIRMLVEQDFSVLIDLSMLQCCISLLCAAPVDHGGCALSWQAGPGLVSHIFDAAVSAKFL